MVIVAALGRLFVFYHNDTTRLGTRCPTRCYSSRYKAIPRKRESVTPSKTLLNLKLEPTTTPTPTRRRPRILEPEDDESLPSSKPKGSPSKKQRQGYAPPEKYAHLDKLTDRLQGGLDVLFCGINPGVKSAEIGLHFGHRNNRFWRCLHQSGFTPTTLPPSAGPSLPEQSNIGLTDLVERPTSKEDELSRDEKIAAVPSFLNKIALFRPRIVCFIGLEIARIVRKRAIPGYTCPSRPSSPTKRSGSLKAQVNRMKPLPPDGVNIQTGSF
ncbi:hypothetical protein E1B28_004957 [Marasmius oreades]|uniref:Uracil-DNA glycosylase-like domain-containing protein n=1 Tax=Marasmius oreades TaxID=181124 RepID=A0A9P7UZR8_9AGAR|nr:uncharacterized protein E1B28_004957 [Marasmius oreades]KAG7097624.1 hypothetical protein E1B28_004957 [Marasmius oreades]